MTSSYFWFCHTVHTAGAEISQLFSLCFINQLIPTNVRTSKERNGVQGSCVEIESPTVFPVKFPSAYCYVNIKASRGLCQILWANTMKKTEYWNFFPSKLPFYKKDVKSLGTCKIGSLKCFLDQRIISNIL